MIVRDEGEIIIAQMKAFCYWAPMMIMLMMCEQKKQVMSLQASFYCRAAQPNDGSTADPSVHVSIALFFVGHSSLNFLSIFSLCNYESLLLGGGASKNNYVKAT